MSGTRKGLLLGAAHLLIVSALGAMLLIDRVRLPHVWVQAAPIDPDLPIRGRYVSLRLVVDWSTTGGNESESPGSGMRLYIRNGRLAAASDEHGRHSLVPILSGALAGGWALRQPVAYFIPEHAKDPSRLTGGEELWVDCTIPKNGPPRPIRLGIKRDDAEIVPIDID
jgi:hypothetical protein